MNNKKTIYIVPHTHWDREWYFSKDTGDVLLNNNLKELIKNIKKNDKMFLDGQWSLIDDYLKSNKDDKNKIIELLKNDNISSGPLYTQPDVINSLGETILRNFEMGDLIAKELGIKNNSVAYLPDTFGFNKNFINILKNANFKNFIFWRGLPQENIEKSLLNKWSNDNASINFYCLKNGYFSLGAYYPYNNMSLQSKKWDPSKNSFVKSKSIINPSLFAKQIKQHIKEYVGFNNEYIFPVGGDQAPFMINQRSFFNDVQKELPHYEIHIVKNYDKFFKKLNSKNIPTFKDDLLMPITGKIHRTISSSRYDMKKSFRDAEEKLYKLLEPLEVYYRGIDKNYDFKTYKNENILKPLFVAQAHDSLGTCNTDSTNKLSFNRLDKIHENIDSQIDLIIKKISQQNNWNEEEIIVFNPAPFINNINKTMIIYSENHEFINFDGNNISVRTLNSENISFSKNDPIYKMKIVVSISNLKPLSINKFIINNKILKTRVPKSLSIKDDNILILKNLLQFVGIENKGDSYDFSPGKNLDITQKHTITNSLVINGFDFYQLKSTLKIKNTVQEFQWEIFLNQDSSEIKIITLNKFKDIRLSLSFIDNKTIWSSRNMGRYEFVKNDIPKDWSKTMKEYPANVGHNDGIIELENVSVITSGNNEFFNDDNHTNITLYRTQNFVTNKNLLWRPTNSGLNWYENAEDSQLQKKLFFEFKLSTKKNSNILVNESKYKPYILKNHDKNFIANKMTRFVINDIKDSNNISKIPEIKFSKKIILESIRVQNKDLLLRLSNLNNKLINDVIIVNKIKHEISLKPNEIKLIKIKKVY